VRQPASSHPLYRVALTAVMLLVTGAVQAVEEAEYTVVLEDGDFEIREYAPSIVAETIVSGEFEDAGSRAFRKLFNYIDGDNRDSSEIAMTAPVSQKAEGRKIAMTSPVSQEPAAEGWSVSFMMPAAYSMDTIPQPNDESVVLREIPSYRAAAIRYSGTWGQNNYEKHLSELKAWIASKDLETTGNPVWARYNAPFTPWFMRRNEILIPLSDG
jgi:effector-binding domain-containing protein